MILKIAYGYTAETHKKDPLIDMAGDAMDKFARAAVPGAFMVDLLPFRTFRHWHHLARQCQLIRCSEAIARLGSWDCLQEDGATMACHFDRYDGKAICIRPTPIGPRSEERFIPGAAARARRRDT